MAHKRGHRNEIPNRWLSCPRKSTGLIADKFVAFKTPLSRRYDADVPEYCRFTTDMLFQSLQSYKIKVGLWIDLTNTSRYYDRADVEAQDAKYIKLNCRGHAETPSDEQIKTFVKLCDNFIRKNPLLSIAVHCTHGFNRTGYLICCFLVEALDWSIEAAVQEFATRREPGIYKPDYLVELYSRYNSDETPEVPDYPDWSNVIDDVVPNDETLDESEDEEISPGAPSHSRPKKFKFECNKKYSFMEGVSGVHQVEPDKTKEIHLKLRSACGSKSKSFPGAQPVSLDQNNISLLYQNPYKVTWKADGIRYMMLIDSYDEIFFADRNDAVFKVDNLIFPRRKDSNSHIESTLLDGEMVIDHVNGKAFPRYLVYDIVLFEGMRIGKRSLDERLQCIKEEIIGPRTQAILKGKIDKSREYFSVRAKDFWDIEVTDKLLSDKFAQTLGHERDGLIFQPVNEPYQPGTCPSVLKWKPSQLNTVDFKLKIVKEDREGMISKDIGLLYVVGHHDRFCTIKVTKSLRPYNNKIIECKYENLEWKFLRERSDKKFPNSYQTAISVVESIVHPITQEALLDYILKCKERHMMPPPGFKK